MKTIHNTRFIANNDNEHDKSGIGIFEFENITYEIPFKEFKHFFEVTEIIKKHREIAKLDALNSVKIKIDTMCKQIIYPDY